ncbi:LOW QUALITY PROTEIN: Palmitoyltransferase, DHHC domain [Dillenia turbinata]|uniref:S-acyltransferase n=1 Tax=Dillenia turbinata TaxID=194707 RepID=A0AAN8Z487_9MAGN
MKSIQKFQIFDSLPGLAEKYPMAKKLYQVWKGNNRFVLNGRLIFGPDAKSLIVTLLLILVPVVIFCTLVARHLLQEFPESNAGYIIVVVAILFTIQVLVLLLLTSSCDPGIVPRNAHPPEEELCNEAYASSGTGGRQTPTLQLPRTKEVLVNGILVTVKYCDTCMLYRPPRCSHCSICNNCVERFDHHCPWVGQCIGVRNYRSFFLFISSSALLCVFVFAMSGLYIKFLADDYGTIWKAMKETPASVMLMTTYENFRRRADNGVNVYDQGCLSNYLEVFCKKIKPSRNNFREYVQEEAPRLPLKPTREVVDSSGPPRAKVEEDLEIGRDLLKISQRREHEVVEDIQNKWGDEPIEGFFDDELGLGSGSKLHAVHSAPYYSNWA